MIKILKERQTKTPVKAAIMDFDGTISTLRYGWPKVMLPMCLEFITDGGAADDELTREVEEYIDVSTGIQTIHQMIWLVERIKSYGKAKVINDPWWYKNEYNRRLMEIVDKRILAIKSGEINRENYIMKGAVDFLRLLKEKNIPIYIASGTDTEDVKNEAEVLGVASFITDILGGRTGELTCAKEIVISNTIERTGLDGEEIMVIGDGFVEIERGLERGAFTIGIASDEEKLTGINAKKEQILTRAGANVIIGDFLERERLMELAGI